MAYVLNTFFDAEKAGIDRAKFREAFLRRLQEAKTNGRISDFHVDEDGTITVDA